MADVTNTMLSSSARTSSGSSDVFNLPAGGKYNVYLNVTAASGTTPTLDCVLQDSPDGTTWYTVASFAQKTTTGTEVIRGVSCGNKVRISYTIDGTTPSFTFTVHGNFEE